MFRTTIFTLSSIALAAAAMPAYAADVTAQRLLDAAKEPQNWLMVHRDYDNSRHSPLSDVNRGNIKDLKLKFLVSIGGTGTGGTMRGKEEGTPLVDDGFMYVADTWSRVTKFDVRSGTATIRRSRGRAPAAASRCTETSSSLLPTMPA
jgi:alcohol dehydrogenase (cytochrome c)